MDIYRTIWDNFIDNILSRNYDVAITLWEPSTRKIFQKSISKFRRKQCQWKKIEYCGSTEDGYIIVKYAEPKGFVAKSVFSFNTFKSGKKNIYGKLLDYIYKLGKKFRNNGRGYFHSICGVLLKHFDVAAREFRSNEIIKRYAIIQNEEKYYLGWSYAKSVIPEKINFIYDFGTFILFSAIDYSPYLERLKKLDEYVYSILTDIGMKVPKINIYFHAKMNTANTGIPKSVFVAPGNNDICIYSIHIKYNTLKHELLHSIIYAATSSWPPLFFREGYAESYDKSNDCFCELIKNYPITFLKNNSLFFDYTEIPPTVAGFLVHFLIKEYGVKRFYTVYKLADNLSVQKALKRVYGFGLQNLKKKTIKYFQDQKL